MKLGGEGCSEPRSRHCTPAWATQRDSISKQTNKKRKHKTTNNCICVCLPQASNHSLTAGRVPSSKRKEGWGRGSERTRYRPPLAASRELPGLGWIQRGPAPHGRGRSGTRAWPAAGTQAAGRGPQWPRHRGGQPGPSGAGSTGGWREMSSPGTGQREGGAGREKQQITRPRALSGTAGCGASPLPAASPPGQCFC